MQDKLSDILDNVLGLLLLEGSYDVTEADDMYQVMIETPDAGKLIGYKGEHLSALQLIVNLILSRQSADEKDLKRVIVDVSGWRQNKESELKEQAKGWIDQVKETKTELELEPMPSWQRRIIHMVVQEDPEVSSESLGEGLGRHLVIRLKDEASES